MKKFQVWLTHDGKVYEVEADYGITISELLRRANAKYALALTTVYNLHSAELPKSLVLRGYAHWSAT